MEVEILKWFLIANLAIGTILRIALIGYQPPEYTRTGAVIALVSNAAVALWIIRALS